jgi:hypothetical protein
VLGFHVWFGTNYLYGRRCEAALGDGQLGRERLRNKDGGDLMEARAKAEGWGHGRTAAAVKGVLAAPPATRSPAAASRSLAQHASFQLLSHLPWGLIFFERMAIDLERDGIEC